MKSKALLHLLVALGLALVAGFLAIKWLGSQRQEPRPVEQVEKKVEVAVAARPLLKGARLGPGMLKLRAYAADSVPARAYLSINDLEGLTLSRDVSEDDPITPDKHYPKGYSASGLAMNVEPGKRAITVKGSKVMGALGLITPGSRVDVVMTASVKVDTGGSDEKDYKVSKLILADVPVLASGSEMETRIGKDGKEELSPVDTYSLMVTPEEAERLALASEYGGSLYFALRTAGDSTIVDTPGADIARALEAYREEGSTLFGMAPQKDAAPAAPPAYADQGESGDYTAETIRGTEKEEVTLTAPESAN